MNRVTSTLWSTRFTILALLVLGAGWCLLNIWVVIAGTLLAIITLRQMQISDNVIIGVRMLLCAAVVTILVALNLYSGNKDLALAAVIYGAMALFTPWKVRPAAVLSSG